MPGAGCTLIKCYHTKCSVILNHTLYAAAFPLPSMPHIILQPVFNETLRLWSLVPSSMVIIDRFGEWRRNGRHGCCIAESGAEVVVHLRFGLHNIVDHFVAPKIWHRTLNWFSTASTTISFKHLFINGEVGHAALLNGLIFQILTRPSL